MDLKRKKLCTIKIVTMEYDVEYIFKDLITEKYIISIIYYFLDNSDVKVFPQYFEADVYGRITVLSKIKENNSYYQTELIKYELYEEKELEEYLEKGIQDEILLPVKKGRQVIYDMVKSGICIIYKFRSKEEEEVMQKLYDFKTGEGQKS
mgnify:CR=1 FL=1